MESEAFAPRPRSTDPHNGREEHVQPHQVDEPDPGSNGRASGDRGCGQLLVVGGAWSDRLRQQCKRDPEAATRPGSCANRHLARPNRERSCSAPLPALPTSTSERTVPDGQLVLLGDDPDGGFGSRHFGFVSAEPVMGTVVRFEG
ncbi:S26 family signal peptidase [Streptosporangium sp. NPDC000239]|uniref:S26 family signal peptidase n=1 Tax=Streptosporangium sp. NPDC000239 TaxID=3154248 RepID=UPI00331EE348